MAQTPLEKNKKMLNTIKNNLIYISEARELLLKQIETANVCLNLERDCIYVILDPPGKSWTPPGEKSWICPCCDKKNNTVTQNKYCDTKRILTGCDSQCSSVDLCVGI